MSPATARDAVRVFVLFDSAITRRWITHHLRGTGRVYMAGEGGSPLAALGDIRRLRPDAVIMHAHDRKKLGIDIPGCIQALSPSTRVILMTSGMNENAVREAESAVKGVHYRRFSEWRKLPLLLHDASQFEEEQLDHRHHAPAG